ncbi:hypothetical protein BOX15_Mlig002157g7, partial [Macrostomum lignano]
ASPSSSSRGSPAAAGSSRSDSGSLLASRVMTSWLGRLMSRRIRFGIAALVLYFCLHFLISRTLSLTFWPSSPSLLRKFDQVIVGMATNKATNKTYLATTVSPLATVSNSSPSTMPTLAPGSIRASGLVSSNLSSCPEDPPGLLGDKFTVLTDSSKAPSWLELEQSLPFVRHGGCQPDDCVAKQRVAIIVPYRNRDAHLRLLLLVLHPMLRRQQLNYRIFAIEQSGTTRFNRAMLFNIGFVEAGKIFQPDCFIFHDVDLLPEHDHNIYRCGSKPRHLSAAIDKFGYKLPYETIFGGACSLTSEQFRAVNGFSNVFFGWGGEDDDFRNRVAWAGFQVSRYPMSIARYKMIKHNRDTKNDPNPQRVNLINKGRKRWKEDGLSSLQYSLVGVQDRHVVYFITVEIPEAEVLRRAHLS